MKIANIALFGVGKMGKLHLKALLENKKAKIAFIFDSDFSYASQIANEYKIRFCEDFEKELENCDGAIIATPTPTHFFYIKKLAPYLKNIFVEKPLTHNIPTSKAIVELAKTKNINIQVGFIERYNPAFLTIFHYLKNKEIKNITFKRYGLKRLVDTSVVLDLMIHDIDLALQINGKIKDIKASGIINNNIIDYASAILTHENGSISNIFASYLESTMERSIVIESIKDNLQCDLYAKRVLLNESIPLPLCSNLDSLVNEINCFIDLCLGEKNQYANQNDGYDAMLAACEIESLINN